MIAAHKLYNSTRLAAAPVDFSFPVSEGAPVKNCIQVACTHTVQTRRGRLLMRSFQPEASSPGTVVLSQEQTLPRQLSKPSDGAHTGISRVMGPTQVSAE